MSKDTGVWMTKVQRSSSQVVIRTHIYIHKKINNFVMYTYHLFFPSFINSTNFTEVGQGRVGDLDIRVSVT